MISEKTVKELQSKKRQLQADMSVMLDSKDCSKESINALRAEILHIDKLIEKKVGTKEIERQNEVRRKKSRKDELTIKSYFEIKSKYKQISGMKVATNRLVSIMDKLNSYRSDEMIKVK